MNSRLLFFPGTLRGALVSFLLFGVGSGLRAASPPSYGIVATKVPGIWKERFPVELLEPVADPEHRGFLYVRYRSRPVYYYRFQGKIPILVRDPENGTEMKTNRYRVVDFWVRYRPGEAEPFDLSFARLDLLPGSYRRWIRR